jgi:RNA polymerase sigma-70 factor, ECF subfamily
MNFDQLLDRYQKPIFNLIFRMVGNMDEASDLTQETFLSVYKNMHTFRGQSSEYTWIYRIAVNKCKDKFKESNRRLSRESFSLDEVSEDREYRISDQERTNYGQPEKAIAQKELKKQIEKAIDRLPHDYKIVVVLRDLQGLSYQQIADTLDISTDMVRTRIARARGMLREKLAGYLET